MLIPREPVCKYLTTHALLFNIRIQEKINVCILFSAFDQLQFLSLSVIVLGFDNDRFHFLFHFGNWKPSFSPLFYPCTACFENFRWAFNFITHIKVAAVGANHSNTWTWLLDISWFYYRDKSRNVHKSQLLYVSTHLYFILQEACGRFCVLFLL